MLMVNFSCLKQSRRRARPGIRRDTTRSRECSSLKEEGILLLWYSNDYSNDLPHWIPYPGGAADEGSLIVLYTLDTND
ncbi:uncharacterized protein SCHCODRAFT_01287002 [Schizophyllum commune H4-8]|uniref:uncharacterized protein n=1 Tax=Schizophyllum commune (strain H4-8 / FGSC 9210) TaxID=578458 RepID=UPI002160B978|nr:uncharacterized protein SCHCODRAFT_01287002 [Schizophyllum commune H4-8]KAI5895727.1 hypothetical protein SCHCODRAFT_01287002 [Schizophyllum commune H4-8]